MSVLRKQQLERMRENSEFLSFLMGFDELRLVGPWRDNGDMPEVSHVRREGEEWLTLEEALTEARGVADMGPSAAEMEAYEKNRVKHGGPIA